MYIIPIKKYEESEGSTHNPPSLIIFIILSTSEDNIPPSCNALHIKIKFHDQVLYSYGLTSSSIDCKISCLCSSATSKIPHAQFLLSSELPSIP